MTPSIAESATPSDHTAALELQEVMDRIHRVAAVWGEMPIFAAIEQEGMGDEPQPILAQYAGVLSLLLEDAGITDGLDVVLEHRIAIETCWHMGTPIERLAYMFLSVHA